MERLGEGLHHTAHCLFPLSHDLPTCPQVSGIFSFLFTLTSLWNFSFPFLCPKKISCCPQLPPFTAKQKSPSDLNGGHLFVPQAHSLGTWAHGNIFEWINHGRDVSWSWVLLSFYSFIQQALLFLPSAGGTTISEMDFLMLRSQVETQEDEWMPWFVGA